ncbi:unnamed protein product [Prorocentrum cordatum]|uniref:Uncharacterized protein n=1 Tax=Prorocentrum cordatum TaxID=2364126 RepID=A0ABN9VFD0_9DINO|nr:unnamed protein product [Polarella glacialis]
MEEQFKAVLERLQRLEDENTQLKEQLKKNEDDEARKKEADDAKKSEAAARARAPPLVPTSVDTKLINKPGEFSGKEADWRRWSVTMRAYLGAVSGRMLELIRKAENFDESLDRVDLDPGDDQLDAQLYFILTMLLKENMMEKLETVEYGEGLLLWRLLMAEFEPKFASRKMALQQAYLNFTFNKDEDPRKGIDRLETQIRQYQAATKKTVDDDTRTGVLLKALAAGSELQKKLGDHLVLNAHRVDTFIEIKIKFAGAPGSSTDRDPSRKRQRVDIAAIEEQLRALSLNIGALKDQDCGSVELCQVSEQKEVGMVHAQTTTNHVTMGLDSGAEVTVWPPELFPQVATEESPESRRGVKYFGPGDRETPSLPNLGRRRYDLRRSANVNVVPVRKPLLAMCSMMDAGHDLHFKCGGRCYAKHCRHEIDHMPYAAWCRSCVAGKGKADPHFLKTSDDFGVQGVACDYCFMGDAVESDKATDKCLPILVHKFYGDRWVSARVVPRKGPETYAVKATVDDVMQAGFAKFTYKSDGEPAIKSLKQEVVKKLREVAGPVDVILEESGTSESQQNAVVERAIWEVQSTARTLVHACLEHHRVQVPLKHPLRIYAVEYAGQLLNRSRRAAKDNRTAYEIRKGKPYRRKLPPFGEAVMYMPVSTVRRRRKFEDRWETGIYLGLVERSNMLLVGTPRGVFKVNCVKRLPAIQSSDPELLKSIVGVPWDPVPGPRFDSESRKLIVDGVRQEHQTDDQEEHRFYDQVKSQESRIRRKRVAPCRLAVQARLRTPFEQKRVAPHCGEVAEIVGELMHLGAIGSRLQEAIRQPIKDDVDVIESEVFCRKRFADQASRWGVHPGVALDLTTGWDLKNQTHVEQHVKAGRATEWLTNSGCIAEELTKLQGGDRENAINSIVNMSPMVESKPAIVAAVLRGLRRQLQQDGAVSINALEPGITGHDTQEWGEDGLEQFFDELTGERLNSRDVREAKVKEIEFLRTFPVYEKVPEAMAKGKEFISTRWTITNKGDVNAPDVRARFVGREFKWKSPAMENSRDSTIGERKILVLDVSRAHFHPKCRRELYIRLPEEDAQAGFVGRLLRTLYGTRDAANAWDEFFNEAIVRREYEVGLSSPCLYYCAAEDSAGWRHGDDLVFEGPDEWLDRLEEGLWSVMILKRRAKLGWGTADDKHVTILNRLVDLNDASRVVSLEPDPRHVDLLRGLVGFDGRSKSVTTPADKRLEDMHDEEPLGRGQATAFRSATMRLAYLAADVPVYGFSANRLARFMAKPTVGSWARLKRCLKYLHGHGRWIQQFPLQDQPGRIDVYADSDWAQAEFVAQVKGGSAAIGMRSMIRDMGGQVSIDLHTDSTAGKGIASRVGLGKVRHLDTGLLWLQHHVNRRDLRIKKVHKDENLADIGTKAVSVTVQETLMKLMNFREATGRHPKALRVAGEAVEPEAGSTVLADEPD